ncbi:MAG TPA: tetratricopeptide repeat protein, partial [bacterium]|nr:tetratricopeptide repeat protein [bacterium]
MRRLLILICAAAVLAGCVDGGPKASRTVKYPNAVTADMRAAFNAANELYRSRRFAEADAAFARIVSDFPYTEITDESRFIRGEIAFAKGDYRAALQLYGEAVSQIESPRIAPKARFKSALALSKLSRPSESLSELSKINRFDCSAVLRLRIDSLGVKASKSAGLPPNSAVVWNLFLLDDYAEAYGVAPTGIPAGELVSEDEALSEVKRWVGDGSVTESEIDSLPMKEMRGKRSGGYASYKLALVYQSAGDVDAALRVLKSFISTYPKHEFYASARGLMSELGGAIGDMAGVKIGVILPLSGRYAIYG